MCEIQLETKWLFKTHIECKTQYGTQYSLRSSKLEHTTSEHTHTSWLHIEHLSNKTQFETYVSFQSLLSEHTSLIQNITREHYGTSDKKFLSNRILD